MSETTIAAGFARGLMELAVQKGASRALLAERSQLDPAQLQDQDRRIPFARYVALMRASKELCGDPALALHFGESFELAEMSIVGLLGGSAENMAEGFALTNRYASLIVETGGVRARDRFVLSRDAEGLWIIDTRENPNDFPELTESTFARMVCASRRYFGETRLIKAVHVTHAEPGYRAEYERIFQSPVVFKSDRNALLTDGEWLTRRTAVSSRYVQGILGAHADGLLKELENSQSVRGRVESLLKPLLQTGEANMETAARKLGVSRQTLFRKLKAEGVTFEQVLDELRHQLALHYLHGKRVPVNEIGYLLGFSDPSSFSRAFRRWTGSSPRMARELVAGE